MLCGAGIRGAPQELLLYKLMLICHTCAAEPCRRSGCGDAWLSPDVRRCAGDACRLPACLPLDADGGPWLPAPELSRRSSCGDACRLSDCEPDPDTASARRSFSLSELLMATHAI